MEWTVDEFEHTVTVTKYEKVKCETPDQLKEAVKRTSNYYKEVNILKTTDATEVIPERHRQGLSRSRKAWGSEFKDIKED